ncbi:hypothetical protein VTO42DRAFT_7362 [Malbranchea cinnamomea]
MASLNVAIVGAGLSGLATLKQCLEEGIRATVFEARSSIGGHWGDDSDPPAGLTSSYGKQHAFTTSIYEGVVLKSCRDTTAFSDFPIDPARYPDYLGRRMFKQYLDEYADHFALKEHIRLDTMVLGCKILHNGKWLVTHRKEGEDLVEELYDAVFACSGHLSEPLIPDIEGKDLFKGEIVHSKEYRRPSRFEGKRVAIIGFGSSAADIACELAGQAKELHLITRRGGWVLPRYIQGKPIETLNSRIVETVLPKTLTKWAQERLCKAVTGTLPKEIQPKHGLKEANITIRSDLLENIKLKRITVRRAEEAVKIQEDGLTLAGGMTLEVDTIIFCTGYRVDYPYLPAEAYRSQEHGILEPEPTNSVDLYKLIVSPRFPKLYFIGLAEVLGPLPPVAEVQARWATAILTNRVRLPSIEAMYIYIRRYQSHLRRNMVNSERHAISIRYLPYCDDLLSDLGAAPKFTLLFKKVLTSSPIVGLRAMKAVYLGISSPAQYRLFGYGAKRDLATETLLRLSKKEQRLSDEERRLLGL